MKKKFQAKFLDGKIIGPLPLEEILLFLEKQGIKENILACEFPGGPWQDIALFSKVEASTHPDFHEFKFSLPKPSTEGESSHQQNVEATKIISEREFLWQNIEKTQVINLPSEKKNVEPPPSQQELVEEEKIDISGITRELDISKHLAKIGGEARAAEEELFKKDEPIVEKTERIIIQTIAEIKSGGKLTRSALIKGVTLGGIVIYLLLEILKPPSGAIDSIEIIPFTVKFPVTSEFVKERESRVAFAEGMKLYAQATYKAKYKAAEAYLKSLQLRFEDNEALEYLILVYSELLPNSKNMAQDANTLFKLIRIGKNKSLSNLNIVMGLGLFYFHNEKIFTSLNIYENFLRIGKPSLKLLSQYLDVLVKIGDAVKAKAVYEKIKNVEFKPVELYVSSAKYLDLERKFGEGKIEILNGIKNYNNSVLLYTELCRYLVRDSDFKGLEKVLKLIENLEADNSPYYFSKYLEYMGILSAVKKDDLRAAKYFKSALEIRESEELRSKLASLKITGGGAVETLVTESKIKENMRLAQVALKEKRYEEAFQFAIEASDLNPAYVPSQLLLSKIQVERGFYNDALETLKKLRQELPDNMLVNQALINAFINSYKLDAAKAEITTLAETEAGKTAIYFSILARYYLKSGNTILGIKNLQEALDKDPLGDENYFLLATEYLKFRKYGRAQIYLANAIELDPTNLDYRALWAKILYELDSADAALGYLRGELARNPDNPKILAEMAIYYFKSGQTKNFEEIKEKIDNMPKKDVSLYKFLVEAAKLEDRKEDILKYSLELIKLFPGDLESKMEIGETFVKARNWLEAQKVFEDVKASLGSYPRVNYFLSSVYMAQNQPDKAEESAKMEITENPTRPGGYYAMGEVYAFRKDFSQAAKMYEKAISLDSKYVEALYALGKVKFKQNYLAESQELFSRAIKENPNYAEIYRDIGFVYRAMGQSGLAIESFETYLKLDPTAKDQDRIKQFAQQLR